MQNLTIAIPAKNEEIGLSKLIPELINKFPEGEILVVNDGSTDNTKSVVESLGAKVISHPYSMGNGAAIKTATRNATGDIIVFMDADGQHLAEEIPSLLEKLEQGFDMAVGARDAAGQASMGRLAANSIYNRLASWMVNQKVQDLTSGFRAVKADKFREFLHLLPNGFSYPTTITMSFFRAGYPICYVPINVQKREGKSHISLVKDGIRFFLIIFKVGTLYSPLKLFLPISLMHFLLGALYYTFTFITEGRFTNMSAVLISTSIVIFLIGLVSEQITTLIFQTRDRTK